MDYEVNPIVKNQPFAGHPRRSGDRSMADTASATIPRLALAIAPSAVRNPAPLPGALP